MARSKQSKSKGRHKAALPAGIVGLSFSLAGAACAESGVAEASVSPAADQATTVVLREEEAYDVSLRTFHVFDRENTERFRTQAHEQLAWWWGCRGCRGCGCRMTYRRCRGR